MPAQYTRKKSAIVAAVSLLFVFSQFPAWAQDSLLQALLDKQSGATAGSAQPPPGSVHPTITMEEQVLPCYGEKGSGARALVNVLGLENEEGNVRLQVYSDNPEEFLESGKRVLRVDVPVSTLDMHVCVTFPQAGTYAMVVMHDRNANGRADILTEGFGFSRNPKLLFSRPDHDQVAFSVPEGVTEMDVLLTYMFRLENKDRRRRKRR